MERFVRKEIPGVFVIAVSGCEMSRDSVHDAAAVGVDQAADERFGTPLDDCDLPRGELDLALVLGAATELREKVWEILRSDGDVDHRRVLDVHTAWLRGKTARIAETISAITAG